MESCINISSNMFPLFVGVSLKSVFLLVASTARDPVYTSPTILGLVSNKSNCFLSFSGNHSSSSSKNAIYLPLEFNTPVFLVAATPLLISWRMYLFFHRQDFRLLLACHQQTRRPLR